MFLLMQYAWSVFSRLPRRLKHSTVKSEILPGKHCESSKGAGAFTAGAGAELPLVGGRLPTVSH